MELGESQILHARGALGIKPSGSLVVFIPKCSGGKGRRAGPRGLRWRSIFAFCNQMIIIGF